MCLHVFSSVACVFSPSHHTQVVIIVKSALKCRALFILLCKANILNVMWGNCFNTEKNVKRVIRKGNLRWHSRQRKRHWGPSLFVSLMVWYHFGRIYSSPVLHHEMKTKRTVALCPHGLPDYIVFHRHSSHSPYKRDKQ